MRVMDKREKGGENQEFRSRKNSQLEHFLESVGLGKIDYRTNNH